MKKCLLLSLVFLPLFLRAQSNFKSGYVISLRGDTIKGYINYKEWQHNPKSIEFKSSPTDKTRSYGFDEIVSFAVNGYVSYEKFNVGISLNAVDISSAPSILDTASTSGTVFLKVLLRGAKAALFSYQDNLKERFYIKDATALLPTELAYGVYQDGDNNRIVDRNDFRLQLSKLVLTCAPGDTRLMAQVQRAAYQEADLIKIAAGINGREAITHSKNDGSKNPFRFFAGAAFVSSTLSYSENGPYYDPQSSTANVPRIAAGIDAVINPPIGHLIFRLEAAYSVNTFSFADKSDPLYNVASSDEYIIKLKQKVLTITPQVVYNVYNSEKLKLFVDLGYSANLVSYVTNRVTTQLKGQPASGSSKVSNSGILDESYTCFQFKTGAVLNKHLEIYASYYPGAEITKSTSYSTNLKSYQFGVNYLF